MSKFNVTVVQLEGSTVHHAFDEIRDSLCWSLSALGHEVSRTESWFSEAGETNIIFGSELIADWVEIPRNSILFNLEQSSHPRMANVKKLAKGLRVWDFSLSNVQQWQKEGFDARHLPIGYTPNLTRIPKAATQDIDIFFAGWLTQRRREFLDALKASGLKIFVASAACYGGVRDEIISRSKLCLNIHHDGRDQFEIVRCSFLMANSGVVVTEPSSDDVDYEDLAPGLVKLPMRIIPDFIRSLLNDDAERNHLAEKAMEVIRKRDFTKAVEAVLDTHPTPLRMSRPLQRTVERDTQRNAYFAIARVKARYEVGCQEGDMKDFLPYLRSIAKGNVLEIGTRDGASTSAFLSGIADTYGHLYSVDVDERCGKIFEGHPSWTFIHADSKDFNRVCKQIPYLLDVILVDGDHSRAGVLNDIEYARQLKPGGLLIFHDILPEERPSACTDCSWPGDDVKNVYQDLCRDWTPHGWTHFEVPGRYGLGVLVKPLAPPAEQPESDESWEGSRALLEAEQK